MRVAPWALLGAALLCGCSSLPASVNPVEWWHGLEGGAIAEQRPPPPGATDPFPNLATVPGKPSPSSPEARKQIADALIADRTNAQHDAALAPLADPSSPTASPALFGQGSAPPPAPAMGWFDPMRVIQGLDALVAWRASEGGRDEPTRLGWGADASHFQVEWSEDGTGVAEPLEGRDGRSVTMALPLLARIMSAHGGSLAVSKRPGLVVRLAWPIARAETADGPA